MLIAAQIPRRVCALGGGDADEDFFGARGNLWALAALLCSGSCPQRARATHGQVLWHGAAEKAEPLPSQPVQQHPPQFCQSDARNPRFAAGRRPRASIGVSPILWHSSFFVCECSALEILDHVTPDCRHSCPSSRRNVLHVRRFKALIATPTTRKPDAAVST